MNEPIAEKIKKELISNDDTRTDNYYWLNERENPKVIDYLNAENAYTTAVMCDTAELQTKLFTEIVDRIKQTDESVPYITRGYYYYYRFEQGKEYPIHCRKKDIAEAIEEILIDGNEMAKGHKYCNISGLQVSPDNKLLAYGIDTVSRRLYMVHIIDIASGRVFDDALPNTAASVAWANDGCTIFYTTKNIETLREDRIMKHVLGTPVSDDVEVFFESDESFTTHVYKSKSRKYIIIASSSTVSNEYRFVDADFPNEPFAVIQPREHNLEYSVDHFNDNFYVRTNLDAQNFRLMKTSVNKTTKDNWQEVIAHRTDVMIDGFEIFRDYLVVAERQNATNMLRVIKWSDKTEHYISFDEEVYEAGINNNPEFDSEQLRFNYSSLTTPNSVYDYHLISKHKQLLKQQEVVGDFDSLNYQSKRLFATAPDGTKVPISIVLKKGIQLNGNNPLLLYGYGSYGISIDPYFSSVRLSLLDRGFVYAIAHIRGGQELGRQWYENGKLLNKMNTFTDFIACGEHLINEKYTSSAKLFAMGGSAGGLLMGVVINLRPELFKGIVAAVPFVDVVTTMLDDTIPLTTGEYDEWGNPNTKQFYDYMKSYSPYDNVTAKDYTNMLVITGLHDSQVQYWEPAKWVAKLREFKTDQNLLLLHTNMEVGHGGASGRFERYKETALEYAFLFKLLSINS